MNITVINANFKAEIEPTDLFMSNANESKNVVWLTDHDEPHSKPIPDSAREEIADIHAELQPLVERLKDIHARHDA